MNKIFFFQTGSGWNKMCSIFMKLRDQPMKFSILLFPKDVSSQRKRKRKTSILENLGALSNHVTPTSCIENKNKTK